MLAAVALSTSRRDSSTRGGRQRAIREAVKGVAYLLGNTPAVARSSHIDPRVFDRYLSGWTIGGALNGSAKALIDGRPGSRTQRMIEEAVVDLLEERDSPAIEKHSSLAGEG